MPLDPHSAYRRSSDGPPFTGGEIETQVGEVAWPQLCSKGRAKTWTQVSRIFFFLHSGTFYPPYPNLPFYVMH